jgi:hypothetical protein
MFALVTALWGKVCKPAGFTREWRGDIQVLGWRQLADVTRAP